MRIGLTASPAELADALAEYPGIQTCRVFAPAGKGIPSWTSPAVSALRKAGVVPWVSHKDWGATDAKAVSAITAWLDTMPADTPEAWLTYHHEPEGDMTSREYRRRWVVYGRTVRAHRHAKRIKIIPIHTLYPSRHKIWDRYNNDWTQWVGVWQQWAPTNPDGSYVGDYMGWDCYLESTSEAYEPPEKFFRVPIGAAYTVGVPLVIPELGALRVPSDSTGAGRAAWILSCVDILAKVDCRAVNWWHATGSAGQNYRLDDRFSASGWRAAIVRFA